MEQHTDNHRPSVNVTIWVDMNVSGKIAIVTGASGGIGEATAKLLASRGAKVVLAARSKNKLGALSAELPDSLAVVADMTKPEDVKNLVAKTVKHFGGIDILVNNAGRGYDAAVEYINLKNFREIFELDVVGPLMAMQQVIPVMRQRGSGAIVNVSSGTALMSLPNMSPYSALKGALASLSLTANEELKKDHISVSVVYPFMTDTKFEKNTIKGKQVDIAWEGGGKLPSIDPPELVAGKILEAIETGKPEVLAHNWMKKSEK